jgi:hypothetical protein
VVGLGRGLIDRFFPRMKEDFSNILGDRGCSEREGEAPAEPKISVIGQIGSSGE